MNLFYFKSDIGNFGDDINPWLWGKLIGDFDQYDDDLDFIGIGSILDDRIKNDRKKIVFGSGVRDFNFRTDTITNLEFRFVRGPISSKILNEVPYITDSAYCIALLRETFNTSEKKYACSIMPYFRQVKSFNWALFEKITGIHVILPTGQVEHIIQEISLSEKIIAGAMHGAIVADALRIPWKRLRFGKHGAESYLTSELKWHDWLYSMGIYDDIEVININNLLFEHSKIGQFFSKKIRFLEMLKKLNFKGKFYLTDKYIFENKMNLLQKEISKFISDYGKN